MVYDCVFISLEFYIRHDISFCLSVELRFSFILCVNKHIHYKIFCHENLKPLSLSCQYLNIIVCILVHIKIATQKKLHIPFKYWYSFNRMDIFPESKSPKNMFNIIKNYTNSVSHYEQ